MKEKATKIIEILIIILIIITSFSAVKKYLPKNNPASSLLNMQDSEFSYIKKEDVATIKNLAGINHIGYMSDTECVSDCMMFQQYTLAPIFIDYSSTKNEYTFGRFSSNEKAIEMTNSNNLDIIKQDGAFYLFKLKK
jgi:hypothetical protein